MEPCLGIIGVGQGTARFVRELAVVIAREHFEGERNLFQIAGALDASSRSSVLGPVHDTGQNQQHEHSEDHRQHHQQLQGGEGPVLVIQVRCFHWGKRNQLALVP